MRAVILAPPRSGTHTLHKTLRDMGVRAGHEEYFTPVRCYDLLNIAGVKLEVGHTFDRWAANDVEISWLGSWPAATMVSLLPRAAGWPSGAKRTALTLDVGIQFRHPWATIRSYLSTGFLTDELRNPYDRYAVAWEEAVRGDSRTSTSRADRCAMFWALWVAQLFELRRVRDNFGRKTWWWRIEDITEPKHADLVAKLVLPNLYREGAISKCEAIAPPQGSMNPLSPAPAVDFEPADLSEFPRELVAYFGSLCGYKDLEELRTWEVARLQQRFGFEELLPEYFRMRAYAGEVTP